MGDHECISCGKCMDVCSQGAISIKAGKITLKAPGRGRADDAPVAPANGRRPGRILWGAAIALLCFAIVWFNFLDPAVRKNVEQERPTNEVEAVVETEESAVTEVLAETEEPAVTEAVAETEEFAVTEAVVETEESVVAEASVKTEVSGNGADYESSAPVGHEVGQQLEDFTVQCYDGSEFHLAQTRGKIVFINLWATHCTPCVHELPYFSELYEAHEGDIAMIAVHSKLVTMDPETFLSDKDYTMPFATDTDDAVTNIVGGTGTLPQTIVLNRRGEVIFNQIGSITPKMLAALYEEADKSA